MRATSVIFLIISVVLALIGVLTCAIGANLAEEQGIELFDEVTDADDNLVYTYNYAGDGIKKIAVELGNAEVQIIGGSDAEYIELINFGKGSYDLTSANLTLSLVDNSNLLKLFAWGADGFNFHGFRHYLHAFEFADKPRIVKIYLTADSAVKLFDLQLEEGALSIASLDLDFDLSAEVGAGRMKLTDLHTDSDIRLTIGEGGLVLEDTVSRSLTVKADRADVDMERYYSMRGMQVNVGEGDIRYSPTQRSFSGYNLKLSAPAGNITCFGSREGQAYEEIDTDDEEYNLVLTAQAGDIIVE